MTERLTLEEIDRELAAIDARPWLERSKHSITRGDLLFVKGFIATQDGESQSSGSPQVESHILTPGTKAPPQGLST